MKLDRIGKFEISKMFFEDNIEIVKQIFCSIVPIRMWHDFINDKYKCYGYSGLFDKNEEGIQCNSYKIIMEKKEDGSYKIGAKKVTDFLWE